MRLTLTGLLLLTSIGCTAVSHENPPQQPPNPQGFAALKDATNTCDQTRGKIEIAIASGTPVCQSNNGEIPCALSDLTIEETHEGCTITHNGTKLLSDLETISCITPTSKATIDHGRSGEICTIETTNRSDTFTNLTRECITRKEMIATTLNSYCNKLPILQVISQASQVIKKILNTYTEDPSAFRITRDNENRITVLELDQLSPQRIYTYAKIAIKYTTNGNILDLNLKYETRRNGPGSYPIDNSFQATLGCNPDTLTCHENSQKPTLTDGQMNLEDAGNLAIRLILNTLNNELQKI